MHLKPQPLPHCSVSFSFDTKRKKEAEENNNIVQFAVCWMKLCHLEGCIVSRSEGDLCESDGSFIQKPSVNGRWLNGKVIPDEMGSRQSIPFRNCGSH